MEPDYDASGTEHLHPIKPPALLIAEDEEVNITYIQIVLARTNIPILLARDGTEAVEMCRNHPEIALVLMDIRMPGMDGLEATGIIREFRPNLPVFALSAGGMADEERRIMGAGCSGFLLKPVKKEKILALVSQYLLIS